MQKYNRFQLFHHLPDCCLVMLMAVSVIIVLAISSPGSSIAEAATPHESDQSLASTNSGDTIWQMKQWSPYWVGVGIGILSWIAFVLSDKPIGVSTAYAQTSGMIEKAVQGRKAEEKPYYLKYVPKVSWTWMLVVGLFVGAFVSATASGDFRFEWVPPLWEGQFGYSPIIRWATAFSGGVVLGVGARWADGCTSGHGISGTLQLIVSSWIAVICFFISGALVAHMIY
jgi:hypothetical protein